MKLLFLDMDGVLNSSQSSSYFWRTLHGRKTFMNGFEELCPICCNNLNYLLECDQEIKVVVSSTWRLFDDIWTDFEKKLSEKVPAIIGRIVGKTPDLDDVPRGHEIHDWLERHGHKETPYVVIDDDWDMEKVRERFVAIDGSVGFDWNKMKEAAHKLGVKLR